MTYTQYIGAAILLCVCAWIFYGAIQTLGWREGLITMLGGVTIALVIIGSMILLVGAWP